MSVRVPLSSLEVCPTEVLEQVAIALVEENLLGPPTDLAQLLKTSTSIYSKISLNNNPSLYSSIFSTKFDARSVTRKLGGHRNAGDKANELVKRFMTLKRFKFIPCREFSTIPTAREDLWVAYLMFIEHDQNNYGQLVHYAGINQFATECIKSDGPFHDRTEWNNGWKVDNEVNALVAWLFWFTDKERVETETVEDRQNVLNALTHVFIGSFKYGSTHAPITSFFIPSPEPLLLSPSWPPYALAALPFSHPTYLKNHFGISQPITHPLLTPAAFLICVVRLEAAEAAASTPSPEDYNSPNRKTPTTKFVEWGPGRGDDFEHDWHRLVTCYSPWTQPMIRRRVFTPGMLAGTWVGRLFEIPQAQFDAIWASRPWTTSQEPQMHVYSWPMQFHVHEYHQHDSSHTIGFNDISQDLKGEGIFRAWLPESLLMTETPRHLDFKPKFFDSNVRATTYEIYDPSESVKRALDKEFERTGPFGQGYDIILTARTDDRFGDVWVYKEYYGRVRDWDGLVVLVSVATDREPSLLFSGYIHGNQNLVGRWRETLTPVDQPGWEGVWSTVKVH